MKEGHIYIYGEIIPWQDDDAGAYGGVNMKDVSNQLRINKEAEQLTIHINSPGGAVYEGFGILDIIRNEQKPTTVIIEGLCASIATIIATAGDTTKATENSTFMVHNPWTMTAGDAAYIEKEVEELRKIENRLIDIYSKKTGLETEDVKQLMEDETFMNSVEAKEKGFIDEIVTGARAVARLDKPKQKNSKMEQEELKKEVGALKKVVNEFKALLAKGTKQPKNLMVQDVNGIEIDMPDIEDIEQVAEGVAATIDGSPASGTYTVTGVGEITFEDGVISSIVPEGGDDEEMEALKQENDDLKEQITELNASAEKHTQEKVQLNAKVEKLEADINNFMAKFSDDKPKPSNLTDPKDSDKKPKFAYKGKKQ